MTRRDGTMKREWIGVGTMLLLLASGGAWSEDTTGEGGDDLLPAQAADEARDAVTGRVPAEATIRLMDAGEADLPETVTSEIALPGAVQEDVAAVEKARRGLENANRARSDRGRSAAEGARARGAEMADRAHEGREIPGRAEKARGRPEDLPAPPGNPGPPGD
ncbi:MAG: hypothetical protein P8172_11655 [Gammaproteobacteria bacterium]